MILTESFCSSGKLTLCYFKTVLNLKMHRIIFVLDPFYRLDLNQKYFQSFNNYPLEYRGQHRRIIKSTLK